MTRRKVLVGLVSLEAATMTVLALVLLVAVAVGRRSSQVGFAVAEVALAALAAAALALVARGLWRERRWASGLGLTLQLFSLPFGVRLWQFGYWYAAIPVLAVVLGALLLLFGSPPPDAGSEGAADPDAQ
jgi:hypothetical protein